jgi:hypothetical protein
MFLNCGCVDIVIMYRNLGWLDDYDDKCGILGKVNGV